MTQVPHSEDVLLLHNIVYKLLVTVRLSERQYRPTIFGAALGMSYVPPEVDEGWHGRIISKSGIPLAGRKIKRYIGVRCDALWRAFSCTNSSWDSK
jgi:hypothetical protein